MKTPIYSKETSLVPKLLNLFYISQTKIPSEKTDSVFFNWFPHLYYKNPLNLLYSSDQFLYEFLLKYPQRKKVSSYKIQLKEQKKLSLFYGSLSKKQLKKYLIQSNASPGEFTKNFISLLERRLDVILYRSQLVKNIAAARQLIIHKKVVVNQKIISIPSYLANPGDIISIPQFKELNKPQDLLRDLKSQNYSRGDPEISLKDWNFKNKFVSKKQIQLLTSLLIKKIQSRAEIQNYENPFFAHCDYSKFHIYRSHECKALIKQRLHGLTHSTKTNLNFTKKTVLRTLSNFSFDKLSKEVFFLDIKKNIRKGSSRNLIISTLNIFGKKPLYLEVSYKIFTVIFLYSPQRIHYPFTLDFDLIRRALLKP